MLETVQTLDQIVYDWFLLTRSDGLTVFFKFITEFGNWKIILSALLCATVALYFRNKRHAYILPLWFSFLSAATTTYLLKALVARPRPLLALVVEKSLSFPSMHATVAVTVYGLLMYLASIKMRKSMTRHVFVFLGFALILLIGVSRLYLGVHYVSDVLAGYVVGGVGIVLGIYIHTKFEKINFM